LVLRSATRAACAPKFARPKASARPVRRSYHCDPHVPGAARRPKSTRAGLPAHSPAQQTHRKLAKAQALAARVDLVFHLRKAAALPVRQRTMELRIQEDAR